MLVAWFSQNCVREHPKLHRIPIGIDYHTMSRNATSWGPQMDPLDQEALLKELNKVHFSQRNLKCYGNFHFSLGHRYAKIDRVDALKNIPKELIDYEEKHCERKETWEKMATYAFVPSPHGNGLDCHRTWEALALGCIVIVRTSPIDSLYEDLPVWIVEEWSDITAESMRKTLEAFRRKTFDMSKLELSYWMKKIRYLQNNKQ